jgi:hypothetical protein
MDRVPPSAGLVLLSRVLSQLLAYLRVFDSRQRAGALAPLQQGDSAYNIT